MAGWLSRPGRLALGALVSAALLYLALREADLAAVGANLRAARLWLLAAALGSVALNTLAKAWRWQLLLRAANPLGAGAAPLGRCLAALLIGQMLNILIPARVGEISRVALLAREGGGALAVTGTIVLEKLLDLACYALLCALALALVPLPAWLSGPLHALLGLGAAAAALAGLAAWLGGAHAPASRLAQRLRPALAAFRALRSPAVRLQALGWSALIWATAALNNLLVLRALRIQAPALAALVLLVVLQAGVTLPSLPATIGVFEALCVAALALFAVSQSAALGYGVLLHALVLLPPVLGGLLCGWRGGTLGLAAPRAEAGP